MKRKRSRLALMGVMSLAICLTVGLASGSIADAKKKGGKKKGGGNSLTLVAGTTAIPPAVAPSGGPPPTAEGRAGFVAIPLTAGRKARGKVVGWDTLTVTSTFTGSDGAALASVGARLVAPNGRTEGLISPVGDAFLQTDPLTGNTTSGPLLETPNSPNSICLRDPGPPPNPPCFFPDEVVGPPSYAGTVGNENLEGFGGVPARGTWQLQLFNTSATTTAVLNGATIQMTLKTAPV